MTPLPVQIVTPVAFAVIVAATWSVGRVSLRLCGGASLRLERRERIVWETALGLLGWGTFLMLLGLSGGLYADAIRLLTIVAAAWGVVEFRRARRRPTEAMFESCDAKDSSRNRLGWLLVYCAVAASGAAFVAASAPPLAGDALCYHLELPKRFLTDHGLTYYRDNDNATFPLLAEMWFLWGLAIDGAITAQLMHWLCGIVTAGAAYCLAMPYVGRSWSAAAAGVTLLAPGINNQMTAPLNDVALAMFTTLALAAWLRAVSEEDRTRSSKWLRLSGLMLGGALSVKYTALVFAVVLGIVAGATIQRMRALRRREWVRSAAVAAVVVAVVAGPWYLRAAYFRGDPVYPFLSAQGANAPSSFPESKRPLGRGFGALIEAPWMMTMQPERFGGRAHQLGPLLLALAPCIAIVGLRRELRPLLAVAVLYAGACVLLRQNVRFLFPLVPITSVVVAAVMRDFINWGAGPRRIAIAATAVLVLFVTAIPIARMRATAAVAAGMESREEFLLRREPTFAAADWINHNLPAEAHVLSQEQRAFYFQPQWTRENVYRRHTAYDRHLCDSKTTVEAELKAAGFTHLFLAESPARGGNAGAPPGYEPTLSRLADEAIAARPRTGPLVVREWRGEVDGETRRYRLLLLR